MTRCRIDKPLLVLPHLLLDRDMTPGEDHENVVEGNYNLGLKILSPFKWFYVLTVSNISKN